MQADAIARFYRQQGRDVFFLTGTDEHGTKIARAAETAGQTPQEFVDEISGKFRELKDALNLSYDDFIRTTDSKRHWPGAQAMWRSLVASGDIYKKIYKGLYCVGHESFITDRDLVDGKCRDHQKEPELIEEENYFFRLSKYVPEIESRIKKNELRIMPENRKNEILALIKEGVEDISFSRPKKSLSWGVPVPDDNTQTMYVWCDALTNYISALGFGSGDQTKFKAYWPADVHLIGKDILRFHALIWPAMLLAAEIELPRALFVHGHITVDGQKMSKTIGNVVDPFDAVKQYGTDPVRHYLLREIPSGDDGDFSYIKLKDRYNSDLANGLGNFAARVTTLAEKTGPWSKEFVLEKNIADKISAAKEIIGNKVAEFKLHEALAAAFELVSFGDQYVNSQRPWETGDKQVIFNLVVLLDNLAAILGPFIPAATQKIKECIVWTKGELSVKKCSGLFPRLS